MLKFINEDLMAFTTMDIVERGKNFTKIKVATSNNLMKYESNSRYNYGVKEEPKFEEKTVKDGLTPQRGARVKRGIESNNDQLIPINREILRISAPLTKISEFMDDQYTEQGVELDLPMSINVNSINKYQPRVDIRCHTQGEDKSTILVVAFPFNGMIKPIHPLSGTYRIYKGLIASSAKPFFYNNIKYRKVLYLVIEINKNVFDSSSKFYSEDGICIDLASYAIFKDRETFNEHTNCEFLKINVVSPDGEYFLNWEYSTVDEPIRMVAEPGEQLWDTFDLEAYRSARYNKNDNNPGKRIVTTNKKKAFAVEGDVLVTTNRHGIRKEIPMNNNSGRKRNYADNNNESRYSDKKHSIEQMMLDSGMFDVSYDDYSGSRRGRKNSGKKKGNKRR